MKKLAVYLIGGALVAVSLAGCGERDQTAFYKAGKYRGKPDTQPWDNAPPSYGSGTWAKGDRETWETQIRSRHGTQNENHRIEH